MESQEMIEGFMEEMHLKGFYCWQCPNCLAALWLEGEPIMLMRYGSTPQEVCEVCVDEIKKVSV